MIIAHANKGPSSYGLGSSFLLPPLRGQKGEEEPLGVIKPRPEDDEAKNIPTSLFVRKFCFSKRIWRITVQHIFRIRKCGRFGLEFFYTGEEEGRGPSA